MSRTQPIIVHFKNCSYAMFLNVFYTLITIFESLNHHFKTLPNDHVCVCVGVSTHAHLNSVVSDSLRPHGL